MVRTGRAIDRVRRRVDDAMIFASLLLLAWPALFADVVRQHRGALAYAVPVGIVAVTGSALVALNRRSRWRWLQYIPVASAVAMTAFWHFRDGDVGPALTWLIIGMAAVIAGAAVPRRAHERGPDARPHPAAGHHWPGRRSATRSPGSATGPMFMDHARDALADADDTMTAVILLDLDGFKEVNDTYGHAAGDELLRVAAERLNANVRANDTVSRLGGDEFVVLLPRLTDDQIADAVANRILRDLAPAAGHRRDRADHPGQRGHRVDPRLRTRRGRRSCARPTWRCTRPRPRARAWPAGSTRPSSPRPSSAGGTRPTCAAALAKPRVRGALPADRRPGRRTHRRRRGADPLAAPGARAAAAGGVPRPGRGAGHAAAARRLGARARRAEQAVEWQRQTTRLRAERQPVRLPAGQPSPDRRGTGRAGAYRPAARRCSCWS